MYYILCLLGGVAAGVVITLLVKRTRTAEGYFKVTPVNVEDGEYSVNICLKPDQNMLTKDSLTLYRDRSRK